MIFNFDKKKIYVGQTKNLNRRASQHLLHLKNGTHPNKDLLLDYQNGDVFYFAVLEETDNLPNEELIIFEKIYMLYFLESNCKLYNKQKKEELREALYCDIVNPRIKEKERIFKGKYHMTIYHFLKCGKHKMDSLII